MCDVFSRIRRDSEDPDRDRDVNAPHDLGSVGPVLKTDLNPQPNLHFDVFLHIMFLLNGELVWKGMYICIIHHHKGQ